MTNDEAIRILSVNGWGFTDGELKEATQMAIQALKEKSEAEEYRTPKKPIARKEWIEDCVTNGYDCPTCGEPIAMQNYCDNCGQKIDWTGEEER